MKDESIRKMVESKRLAHVGGIDVKNVPPSSGKEFVTPSHRRNKRFSSFEEYFDLLGDKKWSVKEFVKNGYSKSQVVAFNFIAKGKLNISRDLFETEYCVNFLSLDEIASKYGIPRDYMAFIREHFGIKRIGAKGLKNGKESSDITDRQKKIAIGCLLGDAKVDHSSFFVKHSDKQRGYCDFVFREFSEHCTMRKLKEDSSYDDRYDTLNRYVYFYTKNHSYFSKLRRLFYGSGEKSVTEELLCEVDDLALAFWFMDDGTSEFKVLKDGNYHLSCAKLFTCSFSYDQNEVIREWLENRWRISAKICFKDGVNSNPFLFFRKDEAKKLIDIIRPHVCDEMLYKISGDCRVGGNSESSSFDLSKIPTKGRFSRLSDREKNSFVSVVFERYRKDGFPYIVLDSDALKSSFDRICNWKKQHLFVDENIIKMNTNSTNIIWHFQPHMFDMAINGSLSPKQVFGDDILFRDAIRRRLTYGGSCSPSGIRSVLKEYKNNRSISNFLPSVAKAVYMYFSNDRQIDVLDFCAGFGGRLLGALGSRCVKRYVGIDVLGENCDGLKNMIGAFDSECEGRIVQGQCENVLKGVPDAFDLVFTSPPYFNTEIYSNGIEQSYNKFPEYEDWLTHWLVPVVVEASEKLRDTGRVALSLGKCGKHNVIDDLVFLVRSKLKMSDVIYFEVPSISYRRGFKPKKREKIIVLEKR